MHCPFCGNEETRVTDSRLAGEGSQVRRRRVCSKCGERFTTFEVAQLVMPLLIKREGKRQPFDDVKLRRGISTALEKRPVSEEAVEDAIQRIKRHLLATGEREVPSRMLGELVMNELRQLDQVAYVRFASVYRRFEDIEAFREELERLAAPAPTAEEQMSLLGEPALPADGEVADSSPRIRARRASGRSRR